MLFNSVDFAVFLPIIFILYWFLFAPSVRRQNLLLFFASYYFYASWNWKFLFLLLFSTLLDYFSGIQIQRAASQRGRTFWLAICIIINAGFLFTFKYYNFFAESFIDLLSVWGIKADPWMIQVILPVGISFYTFHGLSYIIDIYNRRIEPEYNFIDYAVFVSFFPLLVAGPIERATHLLPQIRKQRTFDYDKAIDGLRQILWGLFKKVVIADQCAGFVNTIFDGAGSYSGSTLVLGAILFAFQIYGDFSGYSDIALGVARLFGFELLRNFAYPYFSRDIAEFWRRWHISLSSWFRDYLYIPLGGSRGGATSKIRNTLIIFLVSGFWHGANWTFIIWGLLNALYIIPSVILKTNRNNVETIAQGKMLPTVREALAVAITFALTTFAWIFFRAESLSSAISFIKGIFSLSILSVPEILPKTLMLTILVFMAIEWLGREYPFALARLGRSWPRPARWAMYYVLVFLIFTFSGGKQQFIYFQF